jgi:hypothetical protein
MSQKSRKLPLGRETLRHLNREQLVQAAGGWLRPPITWSCPQR